MKHSTKPIGKFQQMTPLLPIRAMKKLHNLLGEANKLKHEAELREAATKAKAEALEKQLSQLTKTSKK